MKYYLIEENYVGPRSAHTVLERGVYITTAPPTTNGDGRVETDGWLGTTNDWARYAHGEYETADAARQGIIAHVDGVKSMDDLRPDTIDDPTVIESYLIGRYEVLSRAATEDWLHEAMAQAVTAATSNMQLAYLAEAYESESNLHEGCTLTDAEGILRDYRDDLIAEAE